MKIRTAIFVVYVAASAVGFAVLMAFILREVRPRYVESMRRTLSETAVIFAGMLESKLEDTAAGQDVDPEALWGREFGALEKPSETTRVYWTARDDDTSDLDSEYNTRGELRSFIRGRTKSGEEYTLVNGELRVTAPVHFEGMVVGYVGVGRPLEAVTGAIWAARIKLALGSTLIAAIMIAAGWWIANRLSRALERLTAYATDIRDGKDASPPQSRATEIAALSKAFEEMRRALEGKDYIERYTQALTHEIKAPLSAIRGATELLNEGMAPNEQERFLKNIRGETARIQHIIDQLLQLSAIEARHGKIEATRLDLATVVEGVVGNSRSLAEVQGVVLDYAAPNREIPVEGEAWLLSMAVANLVQNAVDFSPAGSTVEIAVEASGSWARVIVSDRGPGIPDYAQQKVFERFFSLPRPKSGRKSTGLGLSLVSEVAALHNGQLTLKNQSPPPGAEARLQIPMMT